MKKLDLAIIISAMSAIVTIIFVWSFYDIIGQIVLFAGYGIIGFFGIIAMLAIGSASWYITENMRIIRARRKKEEAKANKANITIIQNEKQVWIFDHKTGYKHYLSNDPRFYPNGHYTEASSVELDHWKTIHALPGSKSDAISQELPALPAPLPEHVDISNHLTGGPSLRNIFLGVGRLPNGQVGPISAPLSRLINIAVGGSSGFGKSVFMQSLAYQVVSARENPQVVMLDAQGVTFTHWAGNERLLYPLASEPEDIVIILNKLVEEMKHRKDLFTRWRGVDTLEKYNNVASESNQLTVIPIFFDEFGLVAEHEEIAKHAKKISQGGRKVGIPIISASQTWYANEISSAFRANLSTSIQFYARSKSQSRVLLENSRAVELLRPGQALAILPGQPGLIELQAPDISSVVSNQPTLIEESVLQMSDLTEQESNSIKQELNKPNKTAEKDKLFVDLVLDGKSRNEAALIAFKRSYAGDLVGRMKRVLGEI